jgi:hypothetical protein
MESRVPHCQKIVWSMVDIWSCSTELRNAQFLGTLQWCSTYHWSVYVMAWSLNMLGKPDAKTVYRIHSITIHLHCLFFYGFQYRIDASIRRKKLPGQHFNSVWIRKCFHMDIVLGQRRRRICVSIQNEISRSIWKPSKYTETVSHLQNWLNWLN